MAAKAVKARLAVVASAADFVGVEKAAGQPTGIQDLR